MKLCDIGIIGLSVMGRSLALNMADHGFCVAGYNRSRSVTEAVVLEHPHPNLMPVSYTHLDVYKRQEQPFAIWGIGKHHPFPAVIVLHSIYLLKKHRTRNARFPCVLHGKLDACWIDIASNNRKPRAAIRQVDGRFASQPPGVCVKATPFLRLK